MAEIFDALRRDGDSSNTIIGIVIVVLLTVFVAPDVLPQLVAETIPFIEEGLPCSQLLTAQDRANHQSLIGRSATDPLLLRTEINPFAIDGTTNLVIRVIIINETIGTVPFVFNPNQVIVGDNAGSSGVGIIFSSGVTASIIGPNGAATNRIQGQPSIPIGDIKLLGPRQRCVHRIVIEPNRISGTIQPGITQVRSYYRSQIAGIVQQTNPIATPIFTDQGLDIVSGGIVESANTIIPIGVINAVAQ